MVNTVLKYQVMNIILKIKPKKDITILQSISLGINDLKWKEVDTVGVAIMVVATAWCKVLREGVIMKKVLGTINVIDYV